MTKEIINKIISDKDIRINLAKEKHIFFFHTYLSHYVTYSTSRMHEELFEITEDKQNKLSVIVSFRGSAKSTIMTMSYPIWAIIGKPQKKFIMIISQTQQQSKIHLTNLKRELEGNELLRKELGPFQEKDEEWGSQTIVISRFNARIMTASCEQSIRGLRHGQYRPDLIICDDIEDLNSVKTLESRDKTFNWFTGEVIPAGNEDTKIIVIGNLLHEDSLLMRLKEKIDNKQTEGLYRSYPLIDKNNKITWPGRFKNMDDINNFKKQIINEISWMREYLLKIVSDEGQVIKSNWINYYKKIPEGYDYYLMYNAISVDLAIKKESKNDYTAMVFAKVYYINDQLVIYILPNFVNKRMDFPETIQRIKIETAKFKRYPKIFVEDVGYQSALVQQLKEDGYESEGVPVRGQDKRSRLAMTADFIKSGKILFPEEGSKTLINQLVNFGTERYDDLADAFSMLIIQIIEKESKRVRVFIV